MRALVLVGSALAGCVGSGPAAPVAATMSPSPRVITPAAPIAAWFGAWDDEGKFERRREIPKVGGQSFGWRIKTRCTGPLRFREVIQMPAAGDWQFMPDEQLGTTISEDQTATTTVDYAACKQGWIEHSWTVAEGDPAGTYVITVDVDGYATQTFRPQFVAGE